MQLAIMSQKKGLAKLTRIPSGVVNPVGHNLLEDPSEQNIKLERVEMTSKHQQVVLHVLVIGIIFVLFTKVVFTVRIEVLMATLKTKERVTTSRASCRPRRFIQVFHEHTVSFANALKLCCSTWVIWIFIRMGAQSNLILQNEDHCFNGCSTKIFTCLYVVFTTSKDAS